MKTPSPRDMNCENDKLAKFLVIICILFNREGIVDSIRRYGELRLLRFVLHSKRPIFARPISFATKGAESSDGCMSCVDMLPEDVDDSASKHRHVSQIIHRRIRDIVRKRYFSPYISVVENLSFARGSIDRKNHNRKKNHYPGWSIPAPLRDSYYSRSDLLSRCQVVVLKCRELV